MTVRIPKLRTHRFGVQLKPLTIGQSLQIAKMPPSMEQAETTAFLRAAIEEGEGVSDPAKWTVQERLLVLCHYLAATSDEGPNFAVGEGHYTDYLDLSVDHSPDLIPVGEAAGDKWQIRPLFGAYADSLERIAGGVKDSAGNELTGRAHWLIGAMAAMLIREGEESPALDAVEGAIDDWLTARISVFLNFPEPDFAELIALWARGRAKTAHLFAIEFTDKGIVVMPKEGAEELPPARFPVNACLSDFAKAMA